jgi:glycosyltransferase involved in cell wall biosynthesis
LEYLDAGLLVITNDFPINKQICQSSEGIFTTKFKAEDIANQMLKVITISDDKIKKHQDIAQALISEKYNWEIVTSKLMTLFEHLTSTEKRALLISYFFPPLGGAGVQRPLKIAKYAKASHWQVVVLTIDDIVFHSYDPSLLSEIENEVVRADSWDIMSLLQKVKRITQKDLGSMVDRAYFDTDDFKKKLVKSLFFVDEKVGWFIPAVLSGVKQVMKQDFSAIVVTIYPPSSLLIAYTIAKLTKLPLFIDYRDHWTLSSYFDFSCSTSRQAYHNLEKFFLTHAQGIITIGEVMKRELSQSFEIAESKIAVSYNGFDEEDFSDISTNLKLPAEENKSQERIINISYIGNMYKHRTSKYFLQALKELIDSGDIADNLIRLNFMGNYYKEEMEIIKSSGLTEIIKITPQQEHRIAVKEMLNSDILLLLIGTESGKNVLTGKIFEYLRCNRPILGLVPEGGEAEELLQEVGNSWTCPSEEKELIKIQLKNIIDFVVSGRTVEYDIAKYSRANQVKRFFSFIEEKL